MDLKPFLSNAPPGHFVTLFDSALCNLTSRFWRDNPSFYKCKFGKMATCASINCVAYGVCVIDFFMYPDRVPFQYEFINIFVYCCWLNGVLDNTGHILSNKSPHRPLNTPNTDCCPYTSHRGSQVNNRIVEPVQNFVSSITIPEL